MEKALLNRFFKLQKLLSSSILSDELDKLGLRHQILTDWSFNNNKSIMGFIRTMELEDTRTGNENIRKGLSFLESLKKRDVLFVKGSNRFAYFGELMTRLSIKRRLSGAIIYGKTRDSDFTTQIKNFTVFSKGYSPIDIKLRGRVKNTDINFKLGKIKVKTKDIVFADREGVVVIPIDKVKFLYPRVISAINNEKKIKYMIKNKATVNQILNSFKEF